MAGSTKSEIVRKAYEDQIESLAPVLKEMESQLAKAKEEKPKLEKEQETLKKDHNDLQKFEC